MHIKEFQIVKILLVWIFLEEILKHLSEHKICFRFGNNYIERMRLTSRWQTLEADRVFLIKTLGTGKTSLVYDGTSFAFDFPNGNDLEYFAHNNGALVFGKYTNNVD